MEECFKCHVPETRALLFDAISPNGIEKICGKCSAKEDFPLIKEPIYPREEQKTVRERLSKLSGVSLEKKPDLSSKEKDDLRNLVNANYIFKESSELKKDLIHNFHWVVMRARRMRHITQAQLAQEIHEPEMVIRKVEQGHAPEKIDTIRKIEKALGIRIIENIVEEQKEEEKSEDEFNIRNFRDMTIADLHEMKGQKEAELLEEEFELSEIERDEREFRDS